MRDVKRGKEMQSQRDGYEKAPDVEKVSLGKRAMKRKGYLQTQDEGSGKQTKRSPTLNLLFGAVGSQSHTAAH